MAVNVKFLLHDMSKLHSSHYQVNKLVVDGLVPIC